MLEHCCSFDEAGEAEKNVSIKVKLENEVSEHFVFHVGIVKMKLRGISFVRREENLVPFS